MVHDEHDDRHTVLRIIDVHGRIVASTVVCVHHGPEELYAAEVDAALLAGARSFIPALLDEIADLSQRLDRVLAPPAPLRGAPSQGRLRLALRRLATRLG